MESDSTMDLVRTLGPPVVKHSLYAGTAAGLAGAVVGGLYGTVRTTTPILFSTASGIQCFGIGTCYWASRTSLLIAFARSSGSKVSDVTRSERKKASGIAGAITGALAGATMRGRANIIPGVVVFSSVAYAGQSLYEWLDTSQLDHSNSDAGSLLSRASQSRFSPLKTLSDEEYRGMLEEKQIRIQAELALIDGHISRLKNQHQASET